MKMKYRRETDLTPYLFVFPFFLIFTYFYLIPVIKVVLDSFTDYDMFTKRNFIGLENYRKLFLDNRFQKSFFNTVWYTICTLLPALFLGLMTAIMAGSNLIKTPFTRMFIFMPHVLSMVAVSMIWLSMYEPTNGVLNMVCRFFHLQPQKWLLDPALAMWCLIVMGVWKSAGYYMIIFLSGLKNIPEQYYEAAKMDGSRAVNTFFKITLPMLRPTTSFLFITGIISSFNVFEQVNIMTNGGPMYGTTTIVHQIYSNGFTEYRLGYASAMSVVLLLVVSVVTAVNFRLAGNQDM